MTTAWCFWRDKLKALEKRRFRPAYPGFPVKVRGVEHLHAAFFDRKPHE